VKDLTSQPAPSPVDVLTASGIQFTLHRHAHVRSTDDIRERTNLSIERSVKTIAFSVGPDWLVLAAVPGPARIRYGQLATAIGVQRTALRPAQPAMLSAVGMEPGGVSPICTDAKVTVVLDTTVPQLGLVYCGSGQPDSTIELDTGDLVRLVPNLVVADITSSG